MNNLIKKFKLEFKIKEEFLYFTTSLLLLPQEIIVYIIDLSGIDNDHLYNYNWIFRTRWNLAYTLHTTCTFLHLTVIQWERFTTCFSMSYANFVNWSYIAQRFPRVCNISLKNCKKVSSFSMYELVSLWPGLKRVDLEATKVNDTGVIALNQCLQLTHIDLKNTQVGDAGVSTLTRCPELTYVVLRNTKVGDRGVCELAKCLQLKYIDLCGTKVSDVGVSALAKWCCKLLYVNVQHTTVSVVDVEKLRTACPHIEVLSDEQHDNLVYTKVGELDESDMYE